MQLVKTRKPKCFTLYVFVKSCSLFQVVTAAPQKFKIDILPVDDGTPRIVTNLGLQWLEYMDNKVDQSFFLHLDKALECRDVGISINNGPLAPPTGWILNACRSVTILYCYLLQLQSKIISGLQATSLISKKELLTVDPDTDDGQLTYEIITEPKYGYLESKLKSGKPITSFTQGIFDTDYCYVYSVSGGVTSTEQ